MNVDLMYRYINLYWELDWAINAYEKNNKIDFSKLNNGVEQILTGAESCLKILNERKKLTDEEFHNLLLKFAVINNWCDDDYRKILEIAYKKKFIGIENIMTSMHKTIRKSEGHGRDFSWWNDTMAINLKVVYTEDAKLNPKHVYSVSEIEKLVNENKIVILYEEERQQGTEWESYLIENYKKFEWATNEFFKKSGKYVPYTIKYIRSKTPKRKLLELYKKQLLHANSEINRVTDPKRSEIISPKSSIIVSEYYDEFKEKGYAKRLTRLNNVNLNEKKN